MIWLISGTITHILQAVAPPTTLFAGSVMQSAYWKIILTAAVARDEVRPKLRSVAANPHVVFCRVTADEVAEIVRVIDGRRDIDAIFDQPNEG